MKIHGEFLAGARGQFTQLEFPSWVHRRGEKGGTTESGPPGSTIPVTAIYVARRVPVCRYRIAPSTRATVHVRHQTRKLLDFRRVSELFVARGSLPPMMDCERRMESTTNRNVF